jgi:HSP20 family molecular chaperone IbpA
MDTSWLAGTSSLLADYLKQPDHRHPRASSGYSEGFYEITMETPSIKKESIKLSFREDNLTFQADTGKVSYEGGHLQEISSKPYRRVFGLGLLNSLAEEGKKVNLGGKIKVSFGNGTTTIKIPLHTSKPADFEVE